MCKCYIALPSWTYITAKLSPQLQFLSWKLLAALFLAAFPISNTKQINSQKGKLISCQGCRPPQRKNLPHFSKPFPSCFFFLFQYSTQTYCCCLFPNCENSFRCEKVHFAQPPTGVDHPLWEMATRGTCHWFIRLTFCRRSFVTSGGGESGKGARFVINHITKRLLT